MKRIISHVLLLSLAAWFFSCGEEEERQETLTRLRGIGVVSAPLVSAPSTVASPKTVDVTIYVAIPTDATITGAESFMDDPTFGAYMVTAEDMSINLSGVTYTDYDGFRLAQFTTTITVPLEAIFQAINPAFTGIQMRYGVKVSTADDEEFVAGSFLVYTEGSSELDWQSPSVSITSPQQAQVFQTGEVVDLEATITNPNDENIKLGWFSTDGNIQNRRSNSTQWTAPSEAGTYTLLLTIRGKSSRGFGLNAVQVTVE